MATPTDNCLIRRVNSDGQDFVQYFNPITGQVVAWIDGNGVGQGGLASSAGAIVQLPNGIDSGSSANAYVVAPSPAITIAFGASFTFTTTRANTGPATLTVNGITYPLRTLFNQAFSGGEIPGSGQIYQVVFRESEWILAGTLNQGVPASPAGTLNLAGAYLIPVPNTGGNDGDKINSAGLTLFSTPGNSVGPNSFDRNLLNFIWNTANSDISYHAAFGFDGDDVFILTGTTQMFAIEIPVEIFRPVSVQSQQVGNSFTIYQNHAPAPGDAAIGIYANISAPNAGAPMFVIDAATMLITTYNGIPTVGNGVPGIYGAVDLVGQTAAKTTTTLYTPAATGLFRISVYAKVTTPDGSSSTLGGSTGLTIGYTDGTDSVAQTLVAQLATEAGVAAIKNAGNMTATKLVGSVVIFAKTGVAITYAFDYTSGTPATMAYELHLKVEAL